MRRIIKQIFLGIVLGIFLLFVFFIGYFYINQNQIVNVLISEINKKVDAKIEVGPVSMSFWERFPSISIKFNDVIIHNSKHFKNINNDTLLKSKTLFFDLNIRTLFSNTPQINQLSITNGVLNVAFDKQGNKNYQIFSEETSKQETTTDFQIDAFELKNMLIKYHDFSSGENFQGVVKEGNIVGKIESNNFKFSIQAEIEKTNIIPSNYNLYSNYKIDVNLAKYKDETIQWNGTICAKKLNINIDGAYNLKKESISIKCKQIELPSEIIKKIIAQQKITQLQLVKGLIKIPNLDFFSRKNTFQIHFNFLGKTQWTLYHRNIATQAQGQVTFDGKHTLINLKTFDVTHANSNLHFEGNYRYPQNKIKGFSSFSAKISDWKENLKELPIHNLAGVIDGQAQLNGEIKSNNQVFEIIKEGELELKKVAFDIKANNFSITNLNSTMEVKAEKLQITQLNGSFNNNTLEFNGEIKGLTKYLYEKQPLEINGNVFSEAFSLNNFLLISEENTTTEPFQLNDNIRLNLQTKINKIVKDNFEANKVSATIKKFGRRVEIPQIQINTANGFINASGKLVQQANNEWFITTRGNLKKIDVSKIFKQFNDFGQSEIQSTHISGNLTANFRSDFVFSPYFTIKPESIYLLSDIVVVNGQLNNYETLQKLSGYFDVEELKHVTFDTLQNQITITNQTVKFPYMEIRSSAIDLDITGTHTFNNNMNYEISVGLADVLFRKFKKRHQKTVTWEKNKKTMIAVNLKGTDQEYQISFCKIKRKEIQPTKQTPKEKKKFQIDFDDM